MGLIVLVLSLIFGLVIHELFFVIIIVYAILAWLLTTFRDKLILCFIGFLGRQPVTDSCMARKISGFGIGRTFVSTISFEDLKIFVIAEL
jgi:hypothetical protein